MKSNFGEHSKYLVALDARKQKKKTVNGHLSIVHVCTTTRANPSIFSTSPSSYTSTTNRPSFAKANAIK